MIRKLVLTTAAALALSGGASLAASQDVFQEAGIPCFDTPEQAVDAFVFRVDEDALVQAGKKR